VMDTKGILTQRSRPKASRRGLRRLVGSALVLATVAGMACTSAAPRSSAPQVTQTNASETSAPADPLTGQWQREQTCQETMQAFTRAGLSDLIPGYTKVDHDGP